MRGTRASATPSAQHEHHQEFHTAPSSSCSKTLRGARSWRTTHKSDSNCSFLFHPYANLNFSIQRLITRLFPRNYYNYFASILQLFSGCMFIVNRLWEVRKSISFYFWKAEKAARVRRVKNSQRKHILLHVSYQKILNEHRDQRRFTENHKVFNFLMDSHSFTLHVLSNPYIRESNLFDLIIDW